MISIVNCNKNKDKVKACFTLSVKDGACTNTSCTWNMDRANGRCLYEGRSVKNNNTGYRRIYLPSGPVEGRTELEAITLACHTCDISKTCDRLPGAKGVKNELSTKK